jgi:hypothetical protein
MNHDDGTRWRYGQRIHLVGWASELNGTAQVLMPPEYKLSNLVGKRVGHGSEMKKALINPAMMDIAFSGKPLGCDRYYCDYLATLYEWRKKVDGNGREVGNHKYLVDVGFYVLYAFPLWYLMIRCQVDGNGWSSRFKRLITSNSLIFKATIYPEWHVSIYCCRIGSQFNIVL